LKNNLQKKLEASASSFTPGYNIAIC